MNIITQFGTECFAPAFAPCKDNYGCGDASKQEWPNNVLSTRMVVYDSGLIAREGDAVIHRVDADELARCERLSRAAEEIMKGHCVGMKSESDDYFHPYFQAATVSPEGTPPGPPSEVDAALVRKLFAGTICPQDKVFVEPLIEGGFFWREATEPLDELFEDDFDEEEWASINPTAVRARWRSLIRFFNDSDELLHPSFACIGFYEYSAPEGAEVESTEPRSDDEMAGSALPRFPFAFTPAGSVVGLFGSVTWT